MADDHAAAPDVLADPDRLRSLQRVCVGAEPDEAFDRFASLVKRLIGVPVALVSLVDDQRQFFPGQVGLADPLDGKRETPLTHSFCQYVVVEGTPKVFPDARIYAQVRDNLAIPDMGVVAYAGMPLTDHDGRVLGSLCAIDTEPRAWTKNELAVLSDLAAACSSELRLRISRALAEEARQEAEDARAHAESANYQLAMLTSLTEALGATTDVDEALRRLGRTLVPELADWCYITLNDGLGTVRHVSATHRDPRRAADMTRLTELAQAGLVPSAAIAAVQRSGLPIRVDDTSRHELQGGAEVAAVIERADFGSFLVVPITAPVTGQILGAVALVKGRARDRLTEAEERTTVDIGRRAGLAIDNIRLYGRQRHVAEVLQHSLLTELRDIPGIDLHARYLPAQAGTAVGGDWYDAFAQPDGSVMLAVGDVSGHDIEAAATMGQLRNLVRGDAYGRDDEPGPLLSQLDRAVYGLGVPAAATAVLAQLRRDGDAYTVTFSNAGHPPPLLLRPDGEVEVWWERPEPLLGLRPRADRTTHRRTVPAGSTLLLYTDGLVEDPSVPIDDGIARIGAALCGGQATPGEELCSRLLDTVGRRADDIALLLIRLD